MSAAPCRICGKPITGSMPIVLDALSFDAQQAHFPICEDGHVDLHRPDTCPEPWPNRGQP